MIKETSLKSSQDEFLRNSPSFSPYNEQTNTLLNTPHRTEGQINSKSSPQDSDLKSSKAYINAMKALQGKIKKLEAKVQDLQSENDLKISENLNTIGNLKQQMEDERKIFANLESNLKNKLSYLESELNETKKALRISDSERDEMKILLNEESEKRDQDFKQFLKEKTDLKEKLQAQATKTPYLESLNATLEEDLQQLRKEKLALENKNSSLQDTIRMLEETIRSEKNDFEKERESFLKDLEQTRSVHEEELVLLNKEKKELYEEMKKVKKENEELRENLNETHSSLERKKKELEEFRKNDPNVSYTNLSNGKTRFKYYGNNAEKELFSWNTPNHSKNFEKLKESYENQEKVSISKFQFERKETEKTSNILNHQKQNENDVLGSRYEKIPKEIAYSSQIEKKLNFKSIPLERKEKNEDLKENLRQILKNDSFSGKVLSRIQTNKMTEDSEYDKNISTIIDLERELLEMNKSYHELTEQILVLFI